MKLDNMAKLVRELAQSQDSSSLLSQLKSICVLTNSEFDAITKVFSKVELSGNFLAASIQPAVFWA